jgi:ABC-2 type transport system permease protein
LTIILRTMLAGIFRDIHTLIWTIVFPVAMLIGLGLYMDDPAFSERITTGVLTTNVLFGAAMVTAFQVMAQRNRGVYKLLRVTPFSTAKFIAAMTGARTVLTLMVSACIVIMAVLFLGVKIHSEGLLLMLVILLIGTVCFTAVGFLAANLARDESNVNMISNLISFPMLFTSEAFYSLKNSPEWVQTIGQLLPFHYFVKAMSAALNPAGASADVWIPLGILAGFSILCLSAAVFTFRWDTEQAAIPKHWGKRKRRQPTKAI